MKTEIYINKIIEKTGLTREEISNLVEEKKKELKGLISEDGALFIIAKEFGIDVKDESKEFLKDIEINISDISPNMKNITLVGRIKEIYEIREFNKKDGGTGNLGSFLLHDNTGDIRVVVWDEQVKNLESPNFEINEIVKVLNGTAKEGKFGGNEIHVGRFGKLILSPEDVDFKKYPKIKSDIISIKNVNLNLSSVSIEGKILQISQLNTFTRKDGENGKVRSINLMDSSGSIRITLWNADTDKIKEYNNGDYVSIAHLNPKLSKLDSKTIELFASKNTIINKIDKKFEVKTDVSDVINVKDVNLNLLSASIEGKILQISQLNTFTKKDGENGKVRSVNIMDSSASIRITFWNEDTDKIKEYNIEDYISISNLNPRLSKLDSKTIELFASKDTIVSKIDKKFEIKADIIDKIKFLQDQHNIVSFKGLITSIDNLKIITSKTGESIALLSFVVSDDTDGIKTTLWRDVAEKHSQILKVGTGILLKNVMVKYNNFSGRNEISFFKDSSLEIIDIDIKNAKTLDIVKFETKKKITGNYTKIKDIKSAGIYEIKGFIAKEITNINVYEACQKCFKKIENCTCDEKGESELRTILSLIIDDESSIIRATFIGDIAEKLIGEKADAIQNIVNTPDFSTFLENKSNNLLGRDIIIKGKTKFSDYSESYEMVVNDFQDVNVNEELEKVIKEI